MPPTKTVDKKDPLFIAIYGHDRTVTTQPTIDAGPLRLRPFDSGDIDWVHRYRSIRRWRDTSQPAVTAARPG
jgi:hypothetical protein